MFLKSKIDKISDIIYKEFLIKNEVLHKIIIDNNIFKINNITVYIISSFAFHMYFFKIKLLSSFSEDDVYKIFIKCLNKFTSNITNDLSEKNQIVDFINADFDTLDCLMLEVKYTINKEDSIIAMQEVSKFFIEINEENESQYKLSSVAILKLTSYFSYILTDKDLLLKL